MAEEAVSPAEKLLRAIEDEDASLEAEEEVWREYPAASAQEALAPDVLKRYRALLEREDCEAVLPLLLDAYLDRHPEIKGAFFSDKVVHSWLGTVVDEAYPEQDFCEAKQGLAKELARLREEGVALAPYSGMYIVHTTPPAASERDRHLRSIEFLARDDYVPAIRLFLKMESDPLLVRLHPAQRLYLVHRLRILGAPFPDQEAREAAAAAALPADRVREMLCRAELGPAPLDEVFRECFKNEDR
ncbi:MAG: hypothetical protein Q8P46_05380 [Hyphomicrobiales bacterium]|nr:hypothetical protein [Hyphomicrobiales bacterium]